MKNGHYDASHIKHNCISVGMRSKIRSVILYLCYITVLYLIATRGFQSGPPQGGAPNSDRGGSEWGSDITLVIKRRSHRIA